MLYRRQLLGLALGLVGGVVGSHASVGPERPTETGYWRFMEQGRCNNGYIEERWCYYECVGLVCEPLYCEWRMNGQRC